MLIATVFLSIIGAAAGLVLASRAEPVGTRSVDPGVGGAGADQSVADPGSRGLCRDESQAQGQKAGAVGALHVRLELHTATSTVWVCADDADHLYYHANRIRPDGAWIEGETALFLTEVSPADEGYEAVTVDGRGLRTIFFVTPQRLVIVHKDGRKEVQEAVGG